MRRASMAAMILGGAFLVAYLPGRVRRERAPAAGAAAPAVVAAPAPAAAPGGDLKAMLEVGRAARMKPAVPAAERRRARLAAIDRGPADARNGALRALALDDRAAADAIARRSLNDHVLFAESARLLLVRSDGAPTAADLARVRTALQSGEHDESSRASVAGLVLETLVALRSPEAPRFAAVLRKDPSRAVQAVVSRIVGPRTVRGSRSSPG